MDRLSLKSRRGGEHMGLPAIGVLEAANEATGGGLMARGWMVMGWLEALPR